MNNNIILIGFMGTGKSTVSKKLAFLTQYREIDLDKYIEEAEGRSIGDIFATDGEEGFRRLETQYLSKVVSGKDAIISCGGGTALKSENVAIMKENGRVILLTATPDTIYERVKDTTNRPLLKGNMNVRYIEELLNKREEFYKRAADIVIATDDLNIDEISRQILEKIIKNG